MFRNLSEVEGGSEKCRHHEGSSRAVRTAAAVRVKMKGSRGNLGGGTYIEAWARCSLLTFHANSAVTKIYAYVFYCVVVE